MYACINVIERNKFRMFPFMPEHDVSADGPSFRRILDSGLCRFAISVIVCGRRRTKLNVMGCHLFTAHCTCFRTAQIDLICLQMHIKLIHFFKCTIRFDLVINAYVTQSYHSLRAMYYEYRFFVTFGHWTIT